MSIQIESDLKEILGQINQKLDNIQKDVTDIKIDLATTKSELKGDIKTLDERLSGEIKVLREKTEGMNKRLDSTEFINRGIFVGLILAILGGFAKLFGLVGNP
jgi:cob(I)alamin adenosyltransferase